MKLRQSSCLALAALCLLLVPKPASSQNSSSPKSTAPQSCWIWYASICGTETWSASQSPEQITLTATANQTVGQLITLPGTEPMIDMELVLSTDAGDLALGALIDVESFKLQNPNVDLTPVILACGSPGAACNTAISELAGKVSEDQMKKAALWWHGCVNSSDAETKTFTGLQPRFGYVLVVKAEKHSSAAVIANLTLHYKPPQQQMTPVCSATQKGGMPADGYYTNQTVGHVSLAVSPQHGGTVGPPWNFSIYSPSADGVFNVDSTGNVTFTGTVSYQYCPRMPAPQHGPVYPK
jgi:hypothetical protein